MASMEGPQSTRRIERVALWTTVALFLALAVAWDAYPRMLGFHDVDPMALRPGEPIDFGPPHSHVVFFWACLCGILGLLQLRRRWSGHIATVLTWVFLSLSFGFACAAWTFALSTKFWTLSMKQMSSPALSVFGVSQSVARFCMKPSIAVGLLNLGLGFFHGRKN